MRKGVIARDTAETTIRVSLDLDGKGRFENQTGIRFLDHMRLDAPGGLLGHAEIRIGETPVMLADENPEWGVKAPESFGGSPVHLLLYVDDCDTVFARALAGGAKELRPLKDQFYGDRSGTLIDPFGHQWTIATRKEDLSVEEIKRRADEAAKLAGAHGAQGA